MDVVKRLTEMKRYYDKGIKEFNKKYKCESLEEGLLGTGTFITCDDIKVFNGKFAVRVTISNTDPKAGMTSVSEYCLLNTLDFRKAKDVAIKTIFGDTSQTESVIAENTSVKISENDDAIIAKALKVFRKNEPSRVFTTQELTEDIESSKVEETPADTVQLEDTSADTVQAEDTPAEAAQVKDTPTEAAQVKDTPTEAVQVEDTSAETVQVEDTSAETAQVEDTSAETAQAEDTPTETAQAEDTPTETAQAEDNPTETAQAEDNPTESVQVEDTSTETMQVEDTPTESVHTEDNPTESVQVEDNPTESVQVEDTSTETMQVEDTPAETVQVEDTPAESVQVEDTPAENAQVEDTPIETVQAEDTPTETAQAEDNPTEAVQVVDTPIEIAIAEDSQSEPSVENPLNKDFTENHKVNTAYVDNPAETENLAEHKDFEKEDTKESLQDSVDIPEYVPKTLDKIQEKEIDNLAYYFVQNKEKRNALLHKFFTRLDYNKPLRKEDALEIKELLAKETGRIIARYPEETVHLMFDRTYNILIPAENGIMKENLLLNIKDLKILAAATSLGIVECVLKDMMFGIND